MKKFVLKLDRRMLSNTNLESIVRVLINKYYFEFIGKSKNSVVKDLNDLVCINKGTTYKFDYIEENNNFIIVHCIEK